MEPTISLPEDLVSAEASHQHLARNAARAARHGIVIQVNSINAAGDVAMCTVEQRPQGLFRRTLSTTELTWQAEQALAPLIGLGILPMITVRHPELLNTTATVPVPATHAIMRGMQELLTWLAGSRAREGFSPVPGDPFGWKGALALSYVR